MPTPGRLQAHGILFLRKPAYVAREAGTGDFVLVLCLREKWVSRAGHECAQNVDAFWRGPAAESFHRLCGHELKPGCPLEITLGSISKSNAPDCDFTGPVYACTLAPRAAPRPAPAPDAAHAATDAAPASATNSIAPQPATAQAAA